MVRNAAVAPKLWPGGIVYYKIDNTKFSSAVVDNITLAMSQISSKTLRCIKFQERTVQRNYINFVKDDGCFSEIGMKGLDQELSLGTGCNQVGTMMHEILHAIGVSHQHTRNDRDDYVKVNWSQIKASVKVNFEKRDNDNDTNVPYCFNSIMHYGNFAFTSRKDVKTLTSKTKPSMTFGQRVKLENCDIMYLKKLYQCGRGGSGIPIGTSSRSSYSRPSSTIPRSRPSGSSPRKTAFAGEK
ncbi:unnamed protein product [Owenia fusiformis]|uniref:Metalloendopeptidase n=1 Tax=Owenia fusiformis TaxID=6347 RepID=A0A8J1UEI0_OWEFU|nr:unnamed protein product [Owenia fusiformis]